MKASTVRQRGPLLPPVTGALDTSDCLPWTTASWLIGSTKFSVHAYTGRDVTFS